MDKRNLISIGALGVMVFFAFGSVPDEDAEFAFEPEVKGAATEEVVATDSAGTGVAECDAYLKRYRCYLNKSGIGTSAADMAEKSYKDSIQQASSLGGDIAKKAIADSCKQSEDAMKAQFEDGGC
mgnify:CR=1 FL=1